MGDSPGENYPYVQIALARHQWCTGQLLHFRKLEMALISSLCDCNQSNLVNPPCLTGIIRWYSFPETYTYSPQVSFPVHSQTADLTSWEMVINEVCSLVPKKNVRTPWPQSKLVCCYFLIFFSCKYVVIVLLQVILLKSVLGS